MIGDQADIFSRIRGLLPPWFGYGETPILDALLTGHAAALKFAYDLCVYARKQTRIATATDGWLDIIAFDFFGLKLRRAAGEPDNAYRARIQRELFRPKNTRAALRRALLDVTGREPDIFEPSRPADVCGGYGSPSLGYGVAGRYGSTSAHCQVWLTARTSTPPLPTFAPGGYGSPVGGLGVPSRLSYGTVAPSSPNIQDPAIYAAVESVRTAGITVWVNIQP